MFNRKRGQGIIEHVLLVGIVVAALLAMSVYIKRGIQGVIRVASDEIGRQEDAEEIDPQKGTKTNSNLVTKTEGIERQRVFKGGSQERDVERVSVSTGITTYTSEREK